MDRRQFIGLGVIGGIGLVAAPSLVFAQKMKEVLTEWRDVNFYGTIQAWDTNDATVRVSVDVMSETEPGYLWNLGDTIKRQGVIIQDGECFVHWQGRPQKKKFKSGVNRFQLDGTNKVLVINGAQKARLEPGYLTVMTEDVRIDNSIYKGKKTYLIDRPVTLHQPENGVSIYTELF